MSDKIKASDLFEEGFAKEAKAEIDAFKKSIQDTIPLLAKFKEKQGSLQNNPLDNSSNIRQHKKDISDSIKLENEYAAAKAKSAKLLSDAAKKQFQDEKFLNKEIANAAKEEAKRAKAIKDSQSAYQKLSKELIANKKAVKDLLASGKELSAVDKLLIKDTVELDKKLKEIDSQVGDNQRNVGGYKEALNDAAAELGAFGGGLSRIIRTLKILQKENSETTSTTQKMGNALKIITAGLVLAAITLLVKAFEAAKESVLELSDGMEILAAQSNAALVAGIKFNNVFAAKDAAKAYVYQIQQARIEMRLLALQLQRASLDEEHYQQIANDTTIGFEERNKALKESIKFGDRRAEIAVKQAKIELDNANAAIRSSEIAGGKGNANNELKDKQLEATLKYNDALQAQLNLELSDGEKVRQMNEAKAEEEVKLLVSKKEAAHEEKMILENELKDAQKQIEEKKRINQQLLTVERKASYEEMALFKKDIGIKFKNADLLQEKDDIILANKIKNLKTLEGHGLGADGIALLAKIVKTYQENEIAFTIEQGKLDEEKIKRQQKIFQIKAEINDLQNQEDIKIKEREIKDLEKGTYQTDGIRELKRFKVEAKLQDKLQDLKRKELVEKEKNDEIIANNTITDTQELNAEIEKLQTKLNNDLLENDLDHIDKEKEIADKKAEYLRKQLEEELNTTVDFAEQAAKRKDELTEKQLNNDLDMRQRNIEQQQQLAIAGRDNTLAFEKAAAAKDELAKQQLAIKEEKREKAIAFLKLFAAYADKGEPDQALAKTLVQMAIAGAIAGSYFEGTENVGEDLKGNKVHGGKDGYHIAVDGSERILTGNQNKMIGDMSNEDLASLARNYQDGYLPKYITDGNTGSLAQNMTNSLLLQQVTTLNKEISEIKQVLKDRPVPSWNVDKDGTVSKKEYRNGLTKAVTFKPRSPNNYI